MTKWFTRFRYITPHDYHTPLMYLPIQEINLIGDTKEGAWEKFVTGQYAGERDNYRLISMEAYP